MTSVNDVASKFLRLAKEEGIEVSPMKLQKLMFFANGVNLSIHDKPLFDERIEAWKFGPVIPSIYHRFKVFGSESITDYPIDLEKQGLIFAKENLNEEEENSISITWNHIKNYDGPTLSAWTHLPNSPWDKAIKAMRSVIDNKTIKEYFLSIKKPANG